MTTTMTPLSTVIGVFQDHEQADSTIDELRRNKFSYDRIRIVQRGTGGFFDTLKGMFTGQASVASSTADVLMKMGMPEHDARYYQNELDADRVLILMNADERPEEAFNIMRQNGAIEISSRLKTSPSNGRVEAYNPNGSRETNIPTATSYPVVPPTTDPNAPARSYAPNVPNVPPTANPDAPEEVPNPDVSQQTLS